MNVPSKSIRVRVALQKSRESTALTRARLEIARRERAMERAPVVPFAVEASS